MKSLVLVCAVLTILLAGCEALPPPPATRTPLPATATPMPTPMPTNPAVMPATLTTEAQSTKTREQTQLEATVWVLRSINKVPALPDVEVTLEFSADKIEGYTGCNRYEGTYERSGYKLDIVEIAITEQNCPQKNIMEQERRYEDVLWAVTTQTIQDNTLTLKTDSGETLIFLPRP